MNNQIEIYNDFQKMNDHQLIMHYNQELGNPVWTSSREVFFTALNAEFKERGIDCKAISDGGNGLNLSKEYEAFISGKKVFLKKDFLNTPTRIELDFKSERISQKMECYFKRTISHSINLFQLLEHTEQSILLSFEHEHLQTTIDGTGIHNYLMAGFDARNKLIGISFFNQSGTGTFGIQTQAKSVFVFPQNQFDFYASEIGGFELVMK